MEAYNFFSCNLEKENHNLCEAFECTREATERIQVSAGNFGTINLFLCKNCVSKFVVNSVKNEQDDKQ